MKEPVIKALIVEDEPMILKHIVKKINELDIGFEVIDTAINGHEALKKIYELRPDVVYTDIRMPVMDGITLVRHIRVSFPEMPVVILSGYSDFEYMQQCIELSVDAYLLKPVQVVQLRENLQKVRYLILERKKMIKKEILASSLMRGQVEHNLPSDFSRERFQVFLINVGNLSSGLFTVWQTELFMNIWRNIPWDILLQKIFMSKQEWWVLDEHLVNQKIILVANDERIKRVEECVRLLLNILLEYTEGLPVTIVYSHQETEYSQIKIMADRVRLSMQKYLVPCVSKVLCEENIRKKNDEWILEKEWKTLLLEQEGTNRKENFIRLGAAWSAGEIPQQILMRTLEELLIEMERKGYVLFETDIQELMHRIGEIFVVASGSGELYEEIWELLERARNKDECRQMKSSEIVQCIREYLEQHYTEEISLSKLAEKFHFTSAYLSKIYKKYMKETPLRYITALRVEKSKQLLTDHPDLTVQEIAGIVGYEEFHYFCRVFKNMVGLTPTEYREKQEEQQEEL